MQFDQIKSTLDRFCVAWKTNDGATVACFFVEDGSLINPFGERADGRAAVVAMYSEFFGGMLRGLSTAEKLIRPAVAMVFLWPASTKRSSIGSWSLLRYT